MSIPDWTIHGTLPPIRPGAGAVSRDRAPYRATLLEVCRRFGHTAQRRAILTGLLELRDGLRAAGLAPGFQWLNGSFAEDIETIAERPPADVDVVAPARSSLEGVPRDPARRCGRCLGARVVESARSAG